MSLLLKYLSLQSKASLIYKDLVLLKHVSRVRNWPTYQSYSDEENYVVRVRFAPSPTGFLHLGGLRTALFNYLFAKNKNGKFILRIEDTDQSRLISDSIQSIENDLNWLSISCDESPRCGGDYGPYIQSERTHLYIQYMEELFRKGAVYRCFCSPQRLKGLKNEYHNANDNKCRSLTEEEQEKLKEAGVPFCVRFKINFNDIEPFNDLIFGKRELSLSEYEGDFIIIKSDSRPTYHFANVVDDHLMKITHVLRGNEWLSSVPKHLLIYRAFGWNPPVYGHLPQILNEDGSKLSKRLGDLNVGELRRQGYSPETLINYVTSVGGGIDISESKESVMNMQQLTEAFDVHGIGTSSYRIDRNRLKAISRCDLMNKLSDPHSFAAMVPILREELSRHIKCLDSELGEEYLKKVLRWSVNRVHKWNDLVSDKYKYLWMKPQLHKLKGSALILQSDAETALLRVLAQLSSLECGEFSVEKITQNLKIVQEELQLKSVPFMSLLRLAICGLKEGPPVAEVMNLLGYERSFSRLKEALNVLKETPLSSSVDTKNDMF